MGMWCSIMYMHNSLKKAHIIHDILKNTII